MKPISIAKDDILVKLIVLYLEKLELMTDEERTLFHTILTYLTAPQITIMPYDMEVHK